MRNKCFKDFSKKDLFGVILILFGLSDDILIKTNIINKYLVVSDNYIYYVFSLIFTVGTLCCTLLSIIIGASSNRTLGLPLKEIITLEKSPIKLKLMLSKILFLIFISIPALAFNCNTVITILAIILMLLITYYTRILCRIVFEKDYVKDRIKESITENKKINHEYVQNWLTSLFDSINKNDIAFEEEVLSLLKIAADADKQICEQIEKQIPQLFLESCRIQPFIESYKRIIRLNDSSRVFFDESIIIFNFSKSFNHAEPQRIDAINLPGTTDDIISCDFLKDDEKVNYCYWLFKAVINNKNIDKSEKLKIVYRAFCNFIYLYDNDDYGTVRVKTAINLFRNLTLLAEDFEFGKDIFKQLIKAIYISNRSLPSKYLYALIAQIVRFIYFWSYLETETLSEKQRNYISTLPNCNADTNDNIKLSIHYFIEKYSDRIVEFLISDSFVQNINDPLDYWPEIAGGKWVVCSRENKIKFALWFYSIWGYSFSHFPIENYIVTDTEENCIISKMVCVAARNEFDININNNFTPKAKENIVRLQNLYNKRSDLRKDYSFKTINALILNLSKQTEKDSLVDFNETIKQEVLELINKWSEIGIDESISTKSANIVQLPSIWYSKNDNSATSIASIIKSYFTDIVNILISKRLRTVMLSFDIEGVRTLKSELEKEQFSSRNYTFYDDWALSSEVRASEDYLKLKNLIDSIGFIRNYALRPNMFLKVKDVKFNYSFEKIESIPIDGEELEEFLSQHRIANNKYRIDDGIYDLQEAEDYIKEYKALLIVAVKIETNVTDGFQIAFKEHVKSNKNKI